MNEISPVSRRRFLKGTSALVVSFSLVNALGDALTRQSQSHRCPAASTASSVWIPGSALMATAR